MAEYTGKDVVNVIKDLIPAGQGPKSAAIVHADDFFANAIASGLLGEKVVDAATNKQIADLAPGYLKEAGIDVVMQEKWPDDGFNDWLNLANSIKRSGAELRPSVNSIRHYNVAWDDQASSFLCDAAIELYNDDCRSVLEMATVLIGTYIGRHPGERPIF